jgi:tRNA A-37 threonylcarbamoyl transferase component Bud32
MSHGAHVVPGTVLMGKYRVDRVLGAGGMGMVVAATHLHLKEQVALKFLLPEVLTNYEVVQRFLREAQAAVRLKGEHVARVIDVGSLPDGVPYIVMEYLHGSDLSGQLARRGTLPPAETVDYVLQACEALAEAHALGIVHRDLKPANLFLTRRPDGSTLVKVLDFGISKAPVAVESELTRTHAVMGTPSYMSPEQMRSSRDVDGRSDIWSLGVVLYECLSGRRPFESETFSGLCFQVAIDPIPPLRVALPRGLDAAVYRCLEKDPTARFESVADLAAALAPYAGNARAAAQVVERTAAMRGGVSPSVQAGPGTPTTPTTLSGSVVGGERRRGNARWALGGALLSVAAVSITALVLVVGSGMNEPAQEAATVSASNVIATAAAPPPVAAQEPAVPAPTPAAPIEQRVTLQFLIEPATADAEVWVDGKKLEATDVDVPMSRTQRLGVKVTAPGYVAYEGRVLPLSDLAVPVVLVPVERTKKQRPPRTTIDKKPRVDVVKDL